MTEDDKDLQDQLALSELVPDCIEYRQMRLAQILGRFKAIVQSAKARINSTKEYRTSVAGESDDTTKQYPRDDQPQLIDQNDLDLRRTMENLALGEGSDEAWTVVDPAYQCNSDQEDCNW